VARICSVSVTHKRPEDSGYDAHCTGPTYLKALSFRSTHPDSVPEIKPSSMLTEWAIGQIYMNASQGSFRGGRSSWYPEPLCTSYNDASCRQIHVL